MRVQDFICIRGMFTFSGGFGGKGNIQYSHALREGGGAEIQGLVLGSEPYASPLTIGLFSS